MVAPADNHVATTNEKHTLSFISEGLDVADVGRAFVEYIASNTDQALRPPAPTQPRSSKWLQDATVSAVNNAFLLGWKIVELRTRTRIAADLVQAARVARKAGQDAGIYDRELGDPFWLTSIWRATFSEIAAKHFAAFGDQPTAHTVYEPAPGWKPLLPYLYAGAPDYADIGVPDMGSAAGIAATPTLTAFALYDVTRRALNCLALLQVKPDSNSLLAASLRSYTEPLLAALSAIFIEGDDVSDDEAKRVTGIRRLTPILGELLDAWDSFLRENYYAGGRIPNDATEEMAYSAGSALAELSWTLRQRTAVQNEGEGAARYGEWRAAFAERPVSYIQHQLAALGTVLDDAYYRLSDKPKPELTGGRPAPFNPELPSQVLACINQSINFWRKAVRWFDPDWPQPSAASGQATQSIPNRDEQSLPDPPMNAQFESRLSLALVEQSTVWQSLIIGQQTMDAYDVETVMHALLQTVIARFQDQVRKGVWREIRGDTVRKIVPVLGIVIALSIPGLLWLLIAHPSLQQASLNANGLWAVLAVGPAIAGLLGARSLVPSRGGPQTTNVAAAATETTAPASGGGTASAGYLQGMMSTIDSTLVAMLQAASTQLRLDLAALNHQVGVTYPLLDCFIESRFINSVRGDYQFMTQVIWDDTARQEEMEGIVRAALGPLGLLISTRIGENHAGAAPSQSGSVVNVSVTDSVKQGQ